MMDKISIISKLNLCTARYDLSTKEGRLVYGLDAEKIAFEAFERQIIGNNGVWMMPEVDPNNMDSIKGNHFNGDLFFLNPNTNLIEFVDVKSGTSISEHSLNNFRKDGWYFVNAYVSSDGKFYGMVRNNDGFQRWLKKNAFYENGIYKFSYNELRKASLIEENGIELYNRFYANDYRKLVFEVQIGYEDIGLPTNVFKEFTRVNTGTLPQTTPLPGM